MNRKSKKKAVLAVLESEKCVVLRGDEVKKFMLSLYLSDMNGLI